MRNIIQNKKQDRKKRRNQFLLNIGLIFIMFLSLFGYSFNRLTENNKITYNGVNFFEESGTWKTLFKNLELYFSYNPKQTRDMSLNIKNIENYIDKPLYVYSENTEAKIEIYKNLFYYNQIVQRIQEACPEKKECSTEIPIKNCEENFIIIEENSETKIYQENNCVYIQGNKEELIKLTDNFLFNIIGLTQ